MDEWKRLLVAFAVHLVYDQEREILTPRIRVRARSFEKWRIPFWGGCCFTFKIINLKQRRNGIRRKNQQINWIRANKEWDPMGSAMIASTRNGIRLFIQYPRAKTKTLSAWGLGFRYVLVVRWADDLPGTTTT